MAQRSEKYFTSVLLAGFDYFKRKQWRINSHHYIGNLSNFLSILPKSTLVLFLSSWNMVTAPAELWVIFQVVNKHWYEIGLTGQSRNQTTWIPNFILRKTVVQA